MKFSSIPNASVQRCLSPPFQDQCPLFLLPFFLEYLNPWLRIKKMVKKHIVDFHPASSVLTSRLYCLIYLWIPQCFISLQNICWTFDQTCMPHHGLKKISNLSCSDYWKMHLRVKKLNLVILKFFLLMRSRQNFPTGFYQQQHPGRRKLLWELKKWTKLNFWGYCSQVLINPIIFAPFTFLIIALLYHNWDYMNLKHAEE